MSFFNNQLYDDGHDAYLEPSIDTNCMDEPGLLPRDDKVYHLMSPVRAVHQSLDTNRKILDIFDTFDNVNHDENSEKEYLLSYKIEIAHDRDLTRQEVVCPTISTKIIERVDKDHTDLCMATDQAISDASIDSNDRDAVNKRVLSLDFTNCEDLTKSYWGDNSFTPSIYNNAHDDSLGCQIIPSRSLCLTPNVFKDDSLVEYDSEDDEVSANTACQQSHKRIEVYKESEGTISYDKQREQLITYAREELTDALNHAIDGGSNDTTNAYVNDIIGTDSCLRSNSRFQKGSKFCFEGAQGAVPRVPGLMLPTRTLTSTTQASPREQMQTGEFGTSGTQTDTLKGRDIKKTRKMKKSSTTKRTQSPCDEEVDKVKECRLAVVGRQLDFTQDSMGMSTSKKKKSNIDSQSLNNKTNVNSALVSRLTKICTKKKRTMAKCNNEKQATETKYQTTEANIIQSSNNRFMKQLEDSNIRCYVVKIEKNVCNKTPTKVRRYHRNGHRFRIYSRKTIDGNNTKESNNTTAALDNNAETNKNKSSRQREMVTDSVSLNMNFEKNANNNNAEETESTDAAVPSENKPNSVNVFCRPVNSSQSSFEDVAEGQSSELSLSANIETSQRKRRFSESAAGRIKPPNVFDENIDILNFDSDVGSVQGDDVTSAIQPSVVVENKRVSALRDLCNNAEPTTSSAKECSRTVQRHQTILEGHPTQQNIQKQTFKPEIETRRKAPLLPRRRRCGSLPETGNAILPDQLTSGRSLPPLCVDTKQNIPSRTARNSRSGEHSGNLSKVASGHTIEEAIEARGDGDRASAGFFRFIHRLNSSYGDQLSQGTSTDRQRLSRWCDEYLRPGRDNKRIEGRSGKCCETAMTTDIDLGQPITINKRIATDTLVNNTTVDDTNGDRSWCHETDEFTKVGESAKGLALFNKADITRSRPGSGFRRQRNIIDETVPPSTSASSKSTIFQRNGKKSLPAIKESKKINQTHEDIDWEAKWCNPSDGCPRLRAKRRSGPRDHKNALTHGDIVVPINQAGHNKTERNNIIEKHSNSHNNDAERSQEEIKQPDFRAWIQDNLRKERDREQPLLKSESFEAGGDGPTIMSEKNKDGNGDGDGCLHEHACNLSNKEYDDRSLLEKSGFLTGASDKETTKPLPPSVYTSFSTSNVEGNNLKLGNTSFGSGEGIATVQTSRRKNIIMNEKSYFDEQSEQFINDHESVNTGHKMYQENHHDKTTAKRPLPDDHQINMTEASAMGDSNFESLDDLHKTAENHFNTIFRSSFVDRGKKSEGCPYWGSSGQQQHVYNWSADESKLAQLTTASSVNESPTPPQASRLTSSLFDSKLCSHDYHPRETTVDKVLSNGSSVIDVSCSSHFLCDESSTPSMSGGLKGCHEGAVDRTIGSEYQEMSDISWDLIGQINMLTLPYGSESKGRQGLSPIIELPEEEKEEEQKDEVKNS